MTVEIRRVVLTSVGAGSTWAWRDVVTGEPGQAAFDLDGLAVGDDLTVDLTQRRGWVVTRYVVLPERLMASALESLEIGSLVTVGDPVAPTAAEDAWTPPVPGEIRVARHAMDPRTSADRGNVGTDAKRRPCVVVWTNGDALEAGIRFIFGTNSAVHREGRGRRIADWRQAGLRKASVVTIEESIRGYGDLGPCAGALSAADRKRLIT